MSAEKCATCGLERLSHIHDVPANYHHFDAPSPAAGSEPRRWLRTYYGRENVEVIEVGAYDELASALAEALQAIKITQDVADFKLAEAVKEIHEENEKFRLADEKLAEMQRQRDEWKKAFDDGFERVANSQIADLQRRLDEIVSAWRSGDDDRVAAAIHRGRERGEKPPLRVSDVAYRPPEVVKRLLLDDDVAEGSKDQDRKQHNDQHGDTSEEKG